jgi:hypothetical protein
MSSFSHSLICSSDIFSSLLVKEYPGIGLPPVFLHGMDKSVLDSSKALFSLEMFS